MTVLTRLLTVFLALAPAVTYADADPPPVDETYFEKHIRPLLVDHCYECHSQQAGEAMGDLRLDTAAAMRRGGTRGPALVIEGKPDGQEAASPSAAGLLLTAVHYSDPDMQMPPDGKLTDEQIEHLEKWIAGGAPDPRTDEHDALPSKPASPLDRDPSSHWAFVVPQLASPPITPSTEHPDDPAGPDRDIIDAVARVLAGERDLPLNPPADSQTLLRRLSHDLHGLPAPADDLEALQNDPRPDAMIRRVDRMLADPRFAERFTRHWLDVSRYADTVGYAFGGQDRNITDAYRYRQWVIESIAEDMPYDEMIRHQLAGDRTSSRAKESTDPSISEGADKTSDSSESTRNHADAMGFLTLGRRFISHNDTIDDRIDVITRGLLGLTVSCARCHDHKFDPIPTVDYYSMYNVLHNSVAPEKPESAASTLMLVDREPLQDSRIFIRGDQSRQGDVAPRRYLTAFRSAESTEVFTTGSGRLELADAIANASNPLTARVMVNRVWGHLLGRPLVNSPSDFGFRTESIPLQGVLDDLAADFSTHWSLKRLIRRIVLSRIYQQTVTPSQTALTADPDNMYWTHGIRKRRDFESMRDSLLAGCGYLDQRIGGPSVEITETSLTPRRTLYARIDRQNLPGLFRTFDFASPDMHSPQRYFTTVPQQPLFLLNHPQMAQASKLAAARTKSVDELFRCILQRDPTPSERVDAMAFLAEPVAATPLATDPRDTWQYATATWKDGVLSALKPLPTFKDNRWQAEDAFPSPGPLSYASLSREGGHPAHGDDGVIVRRWTSPSDLTISLSGFVDRPSDQGDGITAIIRVRNETLWQESIASGRREYDALQATVRRGDTVDLIIHSNESLAFDGFLWSAKINATPPDSQITTTFDSVEHFSGPHSSEPIPTLDRTEQLAQVLFLSNEFLFVD